MIQPLRLLVLGSVLPFLLGKYFSKELLDPHGTIQGPIQFEAKLGDPPNREGLCQLPAHERGRGLQAGDQIVSPLACILAGAGSHVDPGHPEIRSHLDIGHGGGPDPRIPDLAPEDLRDLALELFIEASPSLATHGCVLLGMIRSEVLVRLAGSHPFPVERKDDQVAILRDEGIDPVRQRFGHAPVRGDHGRGELRPIVDVLVGGLGDGEVEAVLHSVP